MTKPYTMGWIANNLDLFREESSDAIPNAKDYVGDISYSLSITQLQSKLAMTSGYLHQYESQDDIFVFLSVTCLR